LSSPASFSIIHIKTPNNKQAKDVKNIPKQTIAFAANGFFLSMILQDGYIMQSTTKILKDIMPA